MFEVGNQHAKGGKREGAGRRSKKEIQAELENLKAARTATERARQALEDSADKIMGCYVGLASSGNDPATTRHAVDKLLPDEKNKEIQQGDTIIQFTFGSVVVAATPQPEPIEIIPDAIEIKQPSPPAAPRQPGQPPIIERQPIALPGLHNQGRPGFNGGALHLGGDEGGSE
jgi:hypothetical protein